MLAQANRIDDRELVEGYYQDFGEGSHRGRRHTIYEEGKGKTAANFIDPRTLKYSFDGGESFYSESFIRNLISEFNINEIKKGAENGTN